MEQNEINDKKLKELQEWFKKEAESGRPWIFLLLLAIFMPKDVLENLRGGEQMKKANKMEEVGGDIITYDVPENKEDVKSQLLDTFGKVKQLADNAVGLTSFNDYVRLLIELESSVSKYLD